KPCRRSQQWRFGLAPDIGSRANCDAMSALGQKQTFAMHQAMSALPPIATSIAFFGMSASGQKRTLSTSLDHLVGASDQRRRHCKTECLCSAEVDSKIEFCRKFNRKIARLLALEYPGHINTSTPESIRLARAITD